MNPFTTYNRITGKIFQSGYAPDPSIQVVGPDDRVIEVDSNPMTDYVNLFGAPTVMPRPDVVPYPPSVVRVFDSSLGEDSYVFDMTLLPIGTTVTVTNESGESVSTSNAADPVKVTGDETYTVVISPPFPYKDHRQTVDVV